MSTPRFLPVLLATLLAAPAWSQNAGKPLNLKLPPGDLPAASSTSAAPGRDAPGVYYGDTSGRMGNNEPAVADTADDCDDYSYNRPQLHGSVGMGVMSGRHVDGSYRRGTVSLSKAFGSCAHPTGGFSLSIGTGDARFHDHGH